MKKIFFIWVLLSASVIQVRSQTDSVFTLKKCIDYALENSNATKNARLEESVAKAKVGEVRAMGLPQIDAKADLLDNPRLKKSFMPAAFASALAPPSNSPNPSTSPGFDVLESNQNFVVIPNTFQLRNALDLNINASQLIFNGSYIVGLQAAKTYRELSQKASTSSRINVIENVTKAYYLVLINKSRGALLDINIARLDSLLKQTKVMNQNGFVEQIDVDRIEVAYQNLKVEKLKFDNLSNLSYALLKFQMGMPVQNTLEVSGSIEELTNNVQSIQYEANPVADSRIEYSLLQTQKRLNVLDLKRIRSEYLPTIAAFGTVGAFRSATNFTELFSGKYYDYNFWGVSLKQPIFAGFGRSNRAQQAKLTLQKTDNDLFQLQNSITLQVQQSSIALKNNVQTMESLKRNMDLSQNVSRVTKIKYQNGVGSNIELIDAEASYREATTNFYSALYDALVAKIDYQKALGKLSTE